MRTTLCILLLAGCVALAWAPIARAAVPAECGNSYAMLMNGNLTSQIDADGSASLPGALTAAVGVGTISFSPDCSTITGELIFNAGDVQTSPALGESFGPAACLSSRSALGTGLPCFDGANHFTAASITSPGPNGGGSIDLKFTAGYSWLNGTSTTGSMPFEFTLQEAMGAATVLGTSTPKVAGASVPSPILTLTMKRIGTTTTGIPDVPIVYGAPPYLGESVISCNSYNANLSDPYAMINNSLEVVGSFGSAVGALQIFPTNAGFAGGGTISFNSNDNFVSSGAGAGKPGALRDNCPIELAPQSEFVGNPQSQFADGTSNASLILSGISSTCTGKSPVPPGYLTSSVAWGRNENNAYSIITGAVPFMSEAESEIAPIPSDAFQIMPAGGMATCTLLANGRTGSLTNSVAPTSANSRKGASVTISIKFASTTPAPCGVSELLTSSSGDDVVDDGICSLVQPQEGGLVPPNAATAVYSTVLCTCVAGAPADSITGTLTLESSCPINGVTTRTITCHN